MADLFQVIKKNAGWYSLSMFVTGITAFTAIVITKRFLPAEAFVAFNLKLNAIFMVNSICLSWVTLSIFRMKHAKERFFSYDNLLLLGLFNVLLLSIPVFLVWYWLVKPLGGFMLPVIFLFVATFHSLLLVSYQASLKARQTAIAETIRGSCTLVLMFLPVAFRWQVSETYYWNAWMTAYLLSFGFMVYCLRGNTYFGTERQFAWDRYRSDLLDAIRFGWPFTLWVLFSFLLAYADRWYLARSGLSINQSADYLALADSVFRGCGFLFVPLNTAGYPVISKVFDSGDMKATYKLIIKVVKTELLLLAAVIIGLLLFHTFIFNLLGISTGTLSTNIALLALLAFTHGLWQTCSMLQKPAELKMKTGWLAVGNAFGTLIVYGLFFVIVRPQQPLGIVLCLAAGILSYVCFVGVLLFRFVRAQRD